MVQKVEKRSGLKLLETQIGGREGGGAKVTPREDLFGSVRSLLERTG